MKNKPVLVYGGIIVVLTVVIIVATLKEQKPIPQQISTPPQSELPLNHPPIDGMNNNAAKPSKENVARRVQQEIENLQHSVEKEPNNISLLMQLANFLFDAHQMSEAKKYYERILQLDAKNTAARLELSVCYYHEQNFQQAISLMKEILSYEPRNQDAMYNLGSLYATMKNDAEALTWWKRTVQANDTSELAKKSKENISFLENSLKK
ncbi:MAG: tetratricopeptide repeat protein [Ignavibacteria bacterium]|nr:tetratricopeptide repeat protein [Ignavibacteria bacterium]